MQGTFSLADSCSLQYALTHVLPEIQTKPQSQVSLYNLVVFWQSGVVGTYDVFARLDLSCIEMLPEYPILSLPEKMSSFKSRPECFGTV